MLHESLAIAFTVALVLVPIVLFVKAWRATEYSLFQYFLFVAAYLLVKLQWRAQLPAEFPRRKGEGAVIVCNHRGSVDPFFVQMLFREPTHWFVAKEYCVNPAIGWFMRQCEVIPTNRAGIDTAATKLAIRLAAAGEIVGLFPEGRINTTDEPLLPARPGAALVALKARVPIIPCYIHGAPYGGVVWGPFLRLARVRVTLGKPIDLTSYYDRQEEEGVVGEVALRALKELAQLGGHANFEPTLAGRRWKYGVPESDDQSKKSNPDRSVAEEN